MLKKIICIFISFLFLVSSFSIKCYATDKKTDILIMGDSIPYGYNLSVGEKNYGQIIEEYYKGKATVTNISVTGYSTKDLLEQIDKSETKKQIKNADVVIISIGANDLLNVFFERYYEIVNTYNETDFATAAQTIMSDKDGLSDLLNDLDKGTLTAINNIPEIKEKLSKINGNTSIVFQTIYNPFESLTGNPDYTVVSTLSFLLNSLLFQMNKEIKSLDGTETADIYSLFKNTGWLTTNINNYDIHPNQLGHVAIASDIISLLNKDKTSFRKLCTKFVDENIKDKSLNSYRDVALSATDDELRRANADIINSIGVKIPEPPQTTISETDSSALHTTTVNNETDAPITTVTESETTAETYTEITNETTTEITTSESSVSSESTALQSATYESSETSTHAESPAENVSQLSLSMILLIGIIAAALLIFLFIIIKRK